MYVYRTVDFGFSLYSARILKSIRCAQFSFLPRRTYYYCIHTHIYTSDLSGRNVRPPMFIFHQTTEIRNYFSVYILPYHAALHARNSFRAGFFFYDRFNRKVFTYYYYYYHRMCTIRIFSRTIILYRT